jgi:cardiolipin synthase
MFRTILFALTWIIAIIFWATAVILLRVHAPIVFEVFSWLSLIAVAHIIIRKNNPYSIKWVIVVLVLPVVGLLLYLIFSRSDIVGRKRGFRESLSHGASFLTKDPEVYADLGRAFPARKRIAGYLGRKGQPLYSNTKCEYYPLGELQFDAMLRDMEKAERFIFMEYFIISKGELWDKIQDVLIRKAAQGVEVRVMMDDIGSIMTFPGKLIKKLKAHGIQILRFNDVHGFFSGYYFNYRNHQKITVIDGNIGYTGGTNVADEYINAYEKHGHWKDNAIRMEGDAVWSLTVAFLQMWDGEAKMQSDYGAYRPSLSVKAPGFFQPFTDQPMDDDYIAKYIYKSFFYTAKKYIYITTPYLIVDPTMLEALRVAAKGGTDVRIIVPKVWDKWFVHVVTLSNYQTLLEAGVRIYEYTPGFIHCKTVISDDEHAVIGTINMDFRSFYLHYENGVWICDAPIIKDIKKDIEETLALCEEIELETWLDRPWREKCVQSLMRLFAVLF